MQIFVDMDSVLTNFNKAIIPVLADPSVAIAEQRLARATRSLHLMPIPITTVVHDYQIVYGRMGKFFQQYMPVVDEFRESYDHWKDAIGKAMPDGFFQNLEPMSDATELMIGIREFDRVPTILTKPVNKTGDDHEMQCRVEKLHWIVDHFGARPLNFLCVYDKSEYSGPGRVLIDDQLKNIREWVSRGGIGICHETANLTLGRLKTISLEESSKPTGPGLR